MTESPAITYQPIGICHTPFKRQEGAPIQPTMADETVGTIEIFPAFREGLADLEGFSHLIAIYHLHQMGNGALRVVPYLDDREHGIFATRSPKRPNPIGLSVLRLVKREDGLLTVQGVDMLDGTPLLDIKPYLPQFDHHPAERIGWYATAAHRGEPVRADARFTDPPGPAMAKGMVVAVCLSAKVGTAKTAVPQGTFVADHGLQGDAHAASVRQVSLLMAESVDRFNESHTPPAAPGDFAENLLTRGIDLSRLRVGMQIRIGSAVLEVTQIGKEVLPHHYSFHGHRLLPTEGVFCRVCSAGPVAPGDPIANGSAPPQGEIV